MFQTQSDRVVLWPIPLWLRHSQTHLTSVTSDLGGGYFGPKENNVVQAAASAAGSLGLLFTTGFFVAIYQLGLLSATPSQYIGHPLHL